MTEGVPGQPRLVRAHDGPGEVLITVLGAVDGWNVQQWVLQPGCGEGPHSHGDDGIQLERYRVLSGEVVLTVDGHRSQLRAEHGFRVIAPADQRGVVNEGSEQAVLEVGYQTG